MVFRVIMTHALLQGSKGKNSATCLLLYNSVGPTGVQGSPSEFIFLRLMEELNPEPFDRYRFYRTLYKNIGIFDFYFYFYFFCFFLFFYFFYFFIILIFNFFLFYFFFPDIHSAIHLLLQSIRHLLTARDHSIILLLIFAH
jgi:hypothetical protein